MTKTLLEGTIFKVKEINRTIHNQEITRQYVDMDQDAIIVLVYDKSTDRILFTKEYRVGPDDNTYGLVAGKVEPDEPLAFAVNRELREETGVEVTSGYSIPYSTMYTSEGYSNERITPFLFMVNDWKQVKTAQDSDEYVNHLWVDYDAYKENIADKITGLPAQYLLMALDNELMKAKITEFTSDIQENF